MKRWICLPAVFLAAILTACSARNVPGSVSSRAVSEGASGVNRMVSSAAENPPSSVQIAGSQTAVNQQFFLDVSMVSPRSGYAVGKDFHILKTEDGGRDWTDVLAMSSPFESSPDIPGLAAPDGNTVFVASYTASGIEVKRSTDAGESWTKTAIEKQGNDFEAGYGGRIDLSFVNERNGFLLTSGQPALGQMGRMLYHRSDGGKSWLLVSKIPNSGETGISGCTTGMSFSDINNGYFACTNHGQNILSLYRTENGGKDWKAVALPLPDPYRSLKYGLDYYADVYAPAFYGKGGEAKMTVYFCRGEERKAYLYQNTGNTWRLTGAVNKQMTRYGFFDRQSGYGLDETGSLYFSQDGGLNWER